MKWIAVFLRNKYIIRRFDSKPLLPAKTPVHIIYNVSSSGICLELFWTFVNGARFGHISLLFQTWWLSHCVSNIMDLGLKFEPFLTIFSLHKTLTDGLDSCGLLWCFYQLFGLSRHPFTAEDPLVSKWYNGTFLQICSDKETNTFWMACVWAKSFFVVNYSFCFVKLVSHMTHSRLPVCAHTVQQTI